MFYALLAVAFNTMAQPTGRICDAPAHINAQLRISPIECAIDTLVMIVRLLYYSFYHYNSFAQGAAAVITDRFFFDDEEFGHVAELQGNATFRILLGLVTFTQAVKILCCDNVVLTKVWAGIYIIHWVCGEVLLFIKKRMKLTPAQAIAKGYRWELSSHGIGSLTWTIVAFAAFFPLFFGALGTSGLMKNFTGRDWSPIQCIGMVVLVFGCIPFTVASAYALYVRDRPRACGLALMIILIPGVVYLIPILTKDAANTSNTAGHIATGTLAVIWVSCGYLWAVQTLEPLFRNENARDENVRRDVRPIETWLSWWLVFVHLASACIYYQYAYPVQGKTRPSWSEFLG